MYNYSLLNIIELEKALQASYFNGCELFLFAILHTFLGISRKA